VSIVKKKDFLWTGCNMGGRLFVKWWFGTSPTDNQNDGQHHEVKESTNKLEIVCDQLNAY
jgi:hypothetical protein